MACPMVVSLLELPPELLEQIVMCSTLSIRDICHLSQTCKTMSITVNRLWRKISTERWSYWGDCKDNTLDWQSLCKERYQTERSVVYLLELAINKGIKFFMIDEDDMEGFGRLVESNCSLEMVNIILKDILLKKTLMSANLSHQFYALSAYEYLLHQQLLEEWEKILNLPDQEQLLEKGSVLLASWLQPFDDITPESIGLQLDEIAQQVAGELLKTHLSTDDLPSDQPVAQSPLQTALKLKIHRDEILRTINVVLFEQLGFVPSPLADYYTLNNSLINKVLSSRKGIPISMSTIYQAVAYRLGVLLQPVTFPQHFLLKAQRVLERKEGELFIDAYNNGRQLSQEECLALIRIPYSPSPSDFNAAPPFRAYLRMVANTHIKLPSELQGERDIQRNWDEERHQWKPMLLPAAIKLQLHLCSLVPRDNFTILVIRHTTVQALELNSNALLAVKCISCKPATSNRFEYLQHMITEKAKSLNEYKRKQVMEPKKIKHRDPAKVIFRVGMIMKHKRYNYRCVIHGWDEQCEMTESWKQQMGVHSLRLGQDQPFYNVLVDDGTNRYASQESLFMCPKTELGPIMHWEVGKYFTTFTGSEYCPNTPLNEMYPD